MCVIGACSPDTSSTDPAGSSNITTSKESTRTSDSQNPEKNVWPYMRRAEEAVKQCLEYPRDAQFNPGLLSVPSVTEHSNRVHVTGEVVAKNAFGAELTHAYKVVFDHDRLFTVAIGDEIVYVNQEVQQERERAAAQREAEIEAHRRKQERMSPAAGKTATLKPFRTWTDATGEFEVEARLSGQMNDTVRLIKKDGSGVTVPIDKLSEKDTEYIRNIDTD